MGEGLQCRCCALIENTASQGPHNTGGAARSETASSSGEQRPPAEFKRQNVSFRAGQTVYHCAQSGALLLKVEFGFQELM